jgi:hypothetical protein
MPHAAAAAGASAALQPWLLLLLLLQPLLRLQILRPLQMHLMH